MKSENIALKMLYVWFVVSAVILAGVNQGHAFNPAKVNKIINSIEKKRTATIEAARDLNSAVRQYYQQNSGAIYKVEMWVNLSGSTDDRKKKEKFWNIAVKECKAGYKDIRKKYAAWEKKSKSLWQELKKLEQELE